MKKKLRRQCLVTTERLIYKTLSKHRNHFVTLLNNFVSIYIMGSYLLRVKLSIKHFTYHPEFPRRCGAKILKKKTLIKNHRILKNDFRINITRHLNNAQYKTAYSLIGTPDLAIIASNDTKLLMWPTSTTWNSGKSFLNVVGNTTHRQNFQAMINIETFRCKYFCWRFPTVHP